MKLVTEYQELSNRELCQKALTTGQWESSTEFWTCVRQADPSHQKEWAIELVLRAEMKPLVYLLCEHPDSCHRGYYCEGDSWEINGVVEVEEPCKSKRGLCQKVTCHCCGRDFFTTIENPKRGCRSCRSWAQG